MLAAPNDSKNSVARLKKAMLKALLATAVPHP
jgi:hypothetical protein